MILTSEVVPDVDQDDFDYTVKLTSVEAQPGCNVTVSKFYAQGACVGSRQNDIGLSGTVKGLTCAKVEDNTASTCSEVFTSGPKDALIASTTISQGQSFDSGKACYSSDRGYVFVKSTCDTPVKISATVATADDATPAALSGLDWYLVLSVLAVMVTGVANRVMYKMALVPLQNYVFFLAQFQTFGYVLVYGTTLFLRYRAGLVTKQMLDVTPKQLFLAVGALEALSSLLGFIGAARLPGVTLPLLSQSMMLWQLLFAYLLLGKSLRPAQIAGALLVIAGVCAAAWPSQAGASVFQQVRPVFIVVFVISLIFPALATIIKEKIFAAAEHRLGGKKLDIFVVNTCGSTAQALFVFLLLPALTYSRGMSVTELPSYLYQGARCFGGLAVACGSDCSGAPLLPALYTLTNLAFNISALNLLRTAGNVVMSLVMSTIVPLTIWSFTLPLPYLPAAPALGTNFILGTGVLMAGLLTYNSPQWLPALRERVQDQGKAKPA
ncbi:hypothetical protein WJX72_011262 [[Myrmecia] bisecta]|uniref:Uncharacterized protein n=1 Tax=[Myrmecia] bisecta TaxID=41462 RepID=A0AAW1PKR3_9CHLO